MMGMTISETPALPVALAELKAFLRVSVSDEDALLTAQLRAAVELCEAFTGRALIERQVHEMVPAAIARIRLGTAPVRAIESVAAVDDAGNLAALETDAFVAEIDANGDGWVRPRGPPTGRLQVTYRAGIAADWNGVPEMLRHGIVRLAGQYYLRRGDTSDGAPPAAVTALWRPWRRLSIGGQSGRATEDQSNVRAI
jgi:uncharacterized phiE125 gp8 family phage protein